MIKTNYLNKSISLMLVFVLSLGMIFGDINVYAKSRKKSAKPAKVQSLKAKLSGDDVKISWKKRKATKRKRAAKYYTVYIDKGEGWQVLKSKTRKTSFTYKEAEPDTEYRFRVRGYNVSKGKKRYGRYSSAKTFSAPAIKVKGSTNITITQNQKFRIKLSGLKTNNATWSYDSNYVKVLGEETGSEGYYRGKTVGTTTITATDNDGTNSVNVNVTINEKPVYEEDEDEDEYFYNLDTSYDALLKMTELDPRLRNELLDLNLYKDSKKSEKEMNEIKSLVSSLTVGCTTDRQKIEKIIEWFHQNIKYYKDTDWKNQTIDYIWERKYGVCGHISKLIAYMFRCIGIPAGYYAIDLENHACTVFWMDGEWYSTDGIYYDASREALPVPYEEFMLPISYGKSGYITTSYFSGTVAVGKKLSSGYLRLGDLS